MVMRNVSRAVKVLDAIQSRGIRLAIDDFGTGYSSMSLMKQFPIDTIKIDRSFVRDLPNDSEDQAIAQAIISMGKALGMTVIAEGVETVEQQAFLRSHACDEMQGYLFSKPVPPAAIGRPAAVSADAGVAAAAAGGRRRRGETRPAAKAENHAGSGCRGDRALVRVRMFRPARKMIGPRQRGLAGERFEKYPRAIGVSGVPGSPRLAHHSVGIGSCRPRTSNAGPHHHDGAGDRASSGTSRHRTNSSTMRSNCRFAA